MKKKSENKKVSAVAENTPEEQVTNHAEMSDEEFDRYINGIMVEEQGEVLAETVDNQSVMADDIQSLRDDVNQLINSIGALSDYVHSKEAKPSVQPQRRVPVSDAEKAKLFDAIMEERKRYAFIRQQMHEQEEDIKKNFADFNFNALYNSDPEFKAEFDKLGSVYGAYLKYLARKLSASGVQAPGRSFVENGAMPAMTAGSITTSPAGLPDKEFDEYIRSIMGE